MTLTSVPDVSLVSDGSKPDGIDPAELAQLLSDVRDVLRRFIVLEDAQLDMLALWSAHTHVFREFDVTPYLAVMSPTKQSGKTNLFLLLEKLCYEPILTTNISTAALYRAIDELRPTLLLDERDMQKMTKDALGMLHSGYKQGAYVYRSVGGRAQRYYVYCPKAFAGIGMTLTPQLMDRSIHLHMRRKKASEETDKYSIREITRATAGLQDRLANFRDEFIVPDSDPPMPDMLSDREEELWLPLFHIAAQAEDWSARAWSSCVTLTEAARQDETDDAVLLLADLCTAWGNKKRLFSEELLKLLVNLEESQYNGPAVQSKKALASALADYQIHPQQIRIGKETKKGYYRTQFSDAFERYLPE